MFSVVGIFVQCPYVSNVKCIYTSGPGYIIGCSEFV